MRAPAEALPAAGRGRRPALAVAAALWLAVLPAGCGPGLTEADLPDLPEVSTAGFLEPVRRQLADVRGRCQADPLDAEANGVLGMHYLAYRLDSAAEVAFRRARLLQPDRYEWVYYHGVVLASQGQYPEAEQAFRSALAIEPDHPNARARLANILMETGRLKQARDLLEAVLTDYPEQTDARLDLGRVLIRAGEPALAIGHLQQVAAQVPAPGAAYFALASAYRALGDNRAMQENLRLSEQHRDNVLSVNDVAMQRVQRLDQTDEPLFRQAKARYAQGRTDESVALLETALERNPAGVKTYAALIWVETDLGRYARVNELYRKAMAVDADFPQLHYALGRARFKERRFAEAATALERAVAIDPHRSDIRLLLGDVYSQRGMTGRALETYRIAFETDPGNRAAGRAYGEYLMTLDRPADAIEVLTSAADPDDRTTPRIRRIIGEAWLALDDAPAARLAFEAALESARRHKDRREMTVIEYHLRKLTAAGDDDAG